MFDQYHWKAIYRAVRVAGHHAPSPTDKREWRELARLLRENIQVECEECSGQVPLGSAVCSPCGAKPWIDLEKLVMEYIAKLGYTAQGYANAVVRKLYSVENEYNLSQAISKVSAKYSYWIEENANRKSYTFIMGVNDHHIAEEQAESRVKREAYKIALETLTAKLSK